MFFVSLSHDISVGSGLYLLFFDVSEAHIRVWPGFGVAGLGRLAAQPRVWRDRRSPTRLKWRCSLVDTTGIRTPYLCTLEMVFSEVLNNKSLNAVNYEQINLTHSHEEHSEKHMAKSFVKCKRGYEWYFSGLPQPRL